VIHVVTDGTKPGWNWIGQAAQHLSAFLGYRWRKFGIFARLLVVPPEGDWFSLAVGFTPTTYRSPDEVRNLALIFTVRCIFTVCFELQTRYGARNPEALAAHIKKLLGDHTAVIREDTANEGLSKAIDEIADKTPPKDRKLN
jgi:hypothetical protein